MSAPTQLTLTQPDDWHLHLRDGSALKAVAAATAKVFARALVMPNLKPPVTSVALAAAYRQRILAALPPATGFAPLLTLYLTEALSADEIAKAKDTGFIKAIKYYPAGATTHSDAGVAAIERAYPAFAAMERAGLTLCVHGEVTDPAVDVFDRERVFIERHLAGVVARFPALRIVVEHLTTREGVAFVESCGPNVAATLTPQHLLYSRNALFGGNFLRPHLYCLPVLKRETHRQALLAAATSGNPKFFLGTDSAPHARGMKETACGCAGCYSAPAAIELYAEAFEDAGALDKLEAFASFHGADFYGLPRNTRTLTLVREPHAIPDELPFGDTAIVPLRAGETLRWRAKLA
jgi:dihydroorotase